MPAYRFVLLLILCLSWSGIGTARATDCQPAADGLTECVGVLEEFIGAVDYGESGDDLWQEPGPATQAWFAGLFIDFMLGDYTGAQQAGWRDDPELGAYQAYRVIRFFDLDSSAFHFLLMEATAPPDPRFLGGGLYVARPGGLPYVVEAPHPQTDLYTEHQAVELYLLGGPRYLAIAGTRRDSSTLTSECTGGHPRSDASHHDAHLFQIAHELLNDYGPDLIFIQLHGFGASSLARLQQQCGTSDDRLVNLSEGLPAERGKGSRNNFMTRLARQLERDKAATACIYGKDTSSLGATTTLTGRYTNGSSDICFQNATESSHRFVHVEQSYAIRSTGSRREAVNQAIAEAMADYP
ncbi:MAG: hypothetical protein R3202_08410 [Candidatus Competibacterales bacterium]|nr:hypothetical protein [Candidatus Competibacterales bacterium]